MIEGCNTCEWWGYPEDKVSRSRVYFRYPPAVIPNRDMGRMSHNGGLQPWSLTAYPATGEDARCGEWKESEVGIRIDESIKPGELSSGN